MSRPHFAWLLVFFVALPGCQSAYRPPGAPTPIAASHPGPSAAADASIQLVEILSGYERPVFVGSAPGEPDVLYVIEQRGVITTARRDEESWTPADELLDLSAIVLGPEQDVCWDGEFNNERGLLGMAFAGDFASSRLAYVTYTLDASCDAATRGALVLAEILLVDDFPSPSPRVLFSIDKPTDPDGLPHPNHNGGGLAFGPDGLLYIALGEGGHGGGPLAQSLASLWGKLIRIDPHDPDGEGPRSYRVPSDNPYVGQDGALPEIWAVGLRNPWRWTFDRESGDLWIGDVGQFRYESVDMAPADAEGLNAARGLDFGWSRCEAAHRHTGTRPGDPEPPACSAGVAPLLEYEHLSGRCSILGGHVYRGATDAWRGAYFFTDYCDGIVRAITGLGVVTGPQMDRPLSFGELPDGELVVTSQDGSVYALTLEASTSPRPSSS